MERTTTREAFTLTHGANGTALYEPRTLTISPEYAATLRASGLTLVSGTEPITEVTR